MKSDEEKKTSTSYASPKRAALVFIFVTVILDVLSLSVTIPVAPKLIEGMVLQQELPSDFHSESSEPADRISPEKCAEAITAVRNLPDTGDTAGLLAESMGFSSSQAQAFLKLPLTTITANATFYSGLFATVWALMQFVFAPVMGALSDRFGRRKVILISCLGLGLDYVLMALAPNLLWLFVGRVLSGITAASFSTASAYIADVTPPEKRAATFGMIGAAWGFGFVLGPFVGGQLGEIGLRLPFWVAAVLTLLNALYGLFVLPESLPVEKRSEFSIAKANPLGSLRLLRSHKQLLGLATVLLIYQIAHQVFPSVFVFYAGYRYGWGPKVVGNTLMVVGLVSVFMQGFVIRKAAPALGETKMLFIALSFGAAGYFIYGTAPNGWMFWSAIPVFAFVGFFNPAIQGLMTRRVSESEQGRLQGANSSLMGIAGMVGPLVFTYVFKVAVKEDAAFQLPGAPFMLATGLHVVAIVVALFILPRRNVGDTATTGDAD